jgi:hypothetical protein
MPEEAREEHEKSKKLKQQGFLKASARRTKKHST